MLQVKMEGTDFIVYEKRLGPEPVQGAVRVQFCATTLAAPFEVHVTIDPVLDVEPAMLLGQLAAQCGFRVAELFKRNGDPSDIDSFLTGRFSTYRDATFWMGGLVASLQAQGFVVRRQKIECIVLDERFGGQ